jgi:N-formylglutamate deformylase
MKLPILVSVPHAGLTIPSEVEDYCILSEKEIIADGDEGAREIYYSLKSKVAAFVTIDIARAIIDLNRAEDDRRTDGVVKTHTCWNVPVYRQFPPEDVIEVLLERFYRPYHARLRALASGVMLGIDCHTMAAKGPPIGPDPGKERPLICLSNADGTCPQSWMEALVRCFEQVFEIEVSINFPFAGGYIVRSHAAELPWVQLEFSRAPIFSTVEKQRRLLAALEKWCSSAS